MKKFVRCFFFLVVFIGLGSGFLFGKGKSDPASAPLPAGTPIGGTPGAATPLGQPGDLDLQTVAKVTLTKSDYIFVKQLRVEVDRRSKMQEIPPEVTAMDLRRMVLEAMISERLVLQAAERAGISSPNAELEQRIQMVRASAGRPVTDKEFYDGIEKQYGMSYSAFQTYLHEDIIRQKYIEQYIVQAAEKIKAGASISDSDINKEIQTLKDQMAAQAGRVPTDEEFNSFIKQQGMDIVSLRGQVRRQLMVQEYLLSLVGGAPTEEEIQVYYNRYKLQLVRPDTISFDWIQVPFGSTAADRTAARTRAEALARKIGSNSSVFNEESAIAEAAKNSGSARYIPLTPEDPRILQVFGETFIDKAMPLKENGVSGVIEGRQGFFIIKVTRKYPQTNLGLEDIYRWGSPATVRDMLNSQLMQRALTSGAAEVTNTLAEDLRKEGSVEIHEELLVW